MSSPCSFSCTRNFYGPCKRPRRCAHMAITCPQPDAYIKLKLNINPSIIHLSFIISISLFNVDNDDNDNNRSNYTNFVINNDNNGDARA